jgi:nucleoside-diphosphate-sugar epimerase
LLALTGATGFLGGQIAAEAKASGWRVRALVRGTGLTKVSGVAELVEGDLANQDALYRLVDGADAFIHNAGLVRARNRSAFMAANRYGTAAAAEAWRTSGKPNAPFVLISSLAANRPTISHYAESKAEAEKEVASILGARPFAILRPPAIYGPADKATRPLFRAIGRGIVPRIGPRDARFSMVYVNDAASAALAALDVASNFGPIFEIDDGAGGHTWDDLKAAAEEVAGRQLRYIAVPSTLLILMGGVGSLVGRLGLSTPFLTNDKAREILVDDWRVNPARVLPNWKPHTSLQSGFSKTLAWYRAHY